MGTQKEAALPDATPATPWAYVCMFLFIAHPRLEHLVTAAGKEKHPVSAPEFCSGFGGPANVYRTVYKETGQNGKVKKKRRTAGPMAQCAEEESGRALGKRKTQRQEGEPAGRVGTCSDRNHWEGLGSWRIPLMNLSHLDPTSNNTLNT